MIQHTVTFTLKHPAGSPGEARFLEEIATLEQIPTVRNFQRLRQVGKKNNFHFGLSMEFENQSDYEAYNNHPLHREFVENKWIPEVADFLEIDYTPYHQS